MRLLIIGGTVFLGRHLISLALDAGHHVTSLNRGTHDLPEQTNVEKLFADREGDLSNLSGRTFDAVIDTCGFRPNTVRNSLKALEGFFGTYVFISTVSVYGKFPTIGITEQDPITYTNAPDPGNYGTLKADCEETLMRLIPERALIVRPGLIVGPYDPTDRFTYWPARVAGGGMILSPGRPDRLIQFIDVRDLAAWVLKVAEAQERGVFNATGPAERLTMQAFLDTCEQAVREDCQFVWMDDAALVKAGVQPWSELPLWIPDSDRDFTGVMRVDRRKAIDAGLTSRPVVKTIIDTLAWDRTRDPAMPRNAGLASDRETELLRQYKQATARK